MLKGSDVFYCGLDESLCPQDKEHRPGMDVRKEELLSVKKFSGINDVFFSGNKVNKLDKYTIIRQTENTINETKPDMVLIPHPSINQDHQTVYDAALIALRQHDKNFWVKKVLVYECPQSFIWGGRMECNYYKAVDIGSKIQAYRLYKSQQRSYRNTGHIKQMAEVRGNEAKMAYAEGFKVLRWVE